MQRFAKVPAAPRTVRQRQTCAGFSLIELLIALVVFAALSTALLTAQATFGTHSADPMLRVQALSIAQAYLDEILLKRYDDPDGLGSETRPDFDDLLDYQGLDQAPTDQFGAVIGELAAYRVRVAIADSGLGAGIRRVQVNVSHPAGIDISLAAHKADY